MRMLDKLQKVDKDTIELIDRFRDYLFSIGIRTSRERAWAIFQTAYKLPFEMIIKRNKKIKYQGQGVHISSKHGKQQMVIKDVGKFIVQGVSSKKSGTKKAAVKFTPSEDIKQLAAEIEVID